MNARRIDIELTQEQALAAWPAQRPLAALWSGGDDLTRARYTILAAPTRELSREDAERRLRAVAPLLPRERDTPPFQGGMLGWLSYDLGREFEPRGSAPGAIDDRGWPTMQWFDCPDAIIFDRLEGQWWQVGDCGRPDGPHRPPADASVGPLTSALGPEKYAALAERVLEYIRAGDVYQVNLAHRLSGAFRGSGRALFERLAAGAGPWYAGYFESDHAGERRILASVSPELFLEFDPATRRLASRPMKGTRPQGAGMAGELEASGKDKAELAMIVDLMRNDLGRVCDFGTVRVETPRAIERHGTSVYQATACVSGRLAPGATARDVLAAAFPPGSVTGAPKVRAMQIIDELEPVRRGPYCGAVGYIGHDGAFAFSVAIRTALIRGRPAPGTRDGILDGTLDYSVGAGIVAESEPDAEWRETLAKATVIRGATVRER